VDNTTVGFKAAFQSHRVRRGDFNGNKGQIGIPALKNGTVSFNLIE